MQFFPVQYGVHFVMSHLLHRTIFSMDWFDVWIDCLIFLLINWVLLTESSFSTTISFLAI